MKHPNYVNVLWICVILLVRKSRCSFGDGGFSFYKDRLYKGGIRASELVSIKHQVHIPDKLRPLLTDASGDLKAGLNAAEITVCFGSRGHGFKSVSNFMCPEPETDVQAASYSELVALPASKSYCCDKAPNQRCCTSDEFANQNTDSLNKPEPKGMSSGIIAVISISVIFGVVVIAVVIFCACQMCCIMKQTARSPASPGMPTPTIPIVNQVRPQFRPAYAAGGYPQLPMAQPYQPPMAPMPPPMAPPPPPAPY